MSDFGSGHDLKVRLGLSAVSPDPLSPSLSASPPLELSLSKINIKKKLGITKMNVDLIVFKARL